MSRVESLSGWGNYPVVESTVVRPEKRSSLRALIEDDDTQLLARGAGRSYGDASLNGEGRTVLTARLKRMLSFDSETGVLRAEAGVRLREILETFVPRGWFLPVTPGTKEVTLGGAVAFDVHGKNHHCDGGFSNFVRKLRLLLASGDEITCSPDHRSDLFWATVSGAGLTGIITEVELELQPIETAYLTTRHIKAHSLEEAFSLFDEHEPNHQYAVAWIDCLASGADLGRSILMFGDHARAPEVPSTNGRSPLDYESDRLFRMPVDLPSGLLTSGAVRAFNRLYFARQRTKEVQQVESIDSFFYPLDIIGDWNRAYGSRGFVQYQCVLPIDESYEGLVALLRRLSDAGRASFLAVLKRMGPSDRGFLSFPMHGYTLALDIPRQPGLASFLSTLNDIVLDHGGRVYLAKDAHLSADAFRKMYPAYQTWLEVKRRVDPENRFSSTLADRLEIQP